MTEEIRRKRNEYNRAYREKNRERINAYQRKWQKDNPDKVRRYAENYWAKKISEEKQLSG